MPFTARTISTNASVAQSVFAADVDGDGDMDVLSASGGDNKVAWYENDGLTPPSFTEHVISITANFAQSVFAVDVDGDGDVDVLSASIFDDKIAWYENLGGAPPVFIERVISMNALGARSVFATDVDGDGDMDVLSASADQNKIAWYENIGPNGGASPPSFTERIISTNALGAISVFAADVDGDGDMDVLSGSFNDLKIAWYDNDGLTPPGFTEHIISTTANRAISVFAADVDGDGDVDVLSASNFDHKISWYDNESAAGGPPIFTERVISTNALGAFFVFAADVDGDGDMDVLSASQLDDKIAWYDNDGLTPPGFTEHVISVTANAAKSVFTADVDGDGDMDVLSASSGDAKIAWYENTSVVPVFTWTGPDFSFYNTASNWDLGAVPGPLDTALFDTGTPITVVFTAAPPPSAHRLEVRRDLTLELVQVGPSLSYNLLETPPANSITLDPSVSGAAILRIRGGIQSGPVRTRNVRLVAPAAGQTSMLELGNGLGGSLEVQDATITLEGSSRLNVFFGGVLDASTSSIQASSSSVINVDSGTLQAMRLDAAGVVSVILGGALSIVDGALEDVSVADSGSILSSTGALDLTLALASFGGEMQLTQATVLTDLTVMGSIKGSLPSSLTAQRLTINSGGSANANGGALMRVAGLTDVRGSLAADTINVSGPPLSALSGLDTAALSIADGASVNFTSSYTQATGGVLSLELAEPYTTQLDGGSLLSPAPATLAGTLDIVPGPLFNPAIGSVFNIIQAASITGVFDLAVLPAFGDNRFLKVVYPPVVNRAAVVNVAVVVDTSTSVSDFGSGPSSGLMPGAPTGAAVADFDLDTFPDLAVTLSNGPAAVGFIEILFNGGTDAMGAWLGFVSSIQIPVGFAPSDVEAVDLDLDGDFDLVVTNESSDTVTVLLNLSLLRGGAANTRGVLFSSASFAVGMAPGTVTSGDVTGDGFPDIIVTNKGGNSVSILINNNAGSFPTGTTVALSSAPEDATTGDVDNDKDTDIVVTKSSGFLRAGSGSVTVLANLGLGDFSGPPVSFPVGSAPDSLVLVDLDGDGLRDVVAADSGDDTLSMLINNTPLLSPPSFLPAVSTIVGSAPSSLHSLNFEGDADQDLAVIATDAAGARVVRLLRNDTSTSGQLNFTDIGVFPTGVTPLLLATGDVNQDGLADVVAISADPAPPLILRTTTGSVSVLFNQSVQLSPADLDGSGSVDVADLTQLIGIWGPCPVAPAPCPADLDGDGSIGAGDLAQLLGSWG